MPVTYKNREAVQVLDVPAYYFTNPGQDGCTGSSGSRIAQYNAPPAGADYWYEPLTVYDRPDRRRLKGRRGKTGPPFRMTPRSVSTTTVRQFLLRRRNATSNAKVIYDGHCFVGKVNGSCVRQMSYYDKIGPVWTEWDEVTHQSSVSTYTVNSISQAQIDDAIRSVQDSVSTEALTTYDLLTEIAEAREIPSLVSSVASELTTILKALRGRFSASDLRSVSMMRITDMLKHPRKVFRQIGAQWMRYRYGIMPLVYSYRDLKKTLDKGVNGRCYKTAKIASTPTGVSLPAPTVNYNWKETTGEVTIRGTAFMHYETASGAQIASLGMNPLVTAWELIPYSFVIDWFVNVGDYITRMTSQQGTKMQWACISQRSSISERTWRHYPNEDKYLTCDNVITNWVGSTPPASPAVLISRPQESQLWLETETQSYDRWLFDLSAAQLSYSPSLNWKRMIDSAVMANNQLGALIKLFKR